MDDIDLQPVVIFVGNYGSGKTEVAVNLAFSSKQKGMSVQIADIDVVNPYFRSREVRVEMESMGIEVITPDERWIDADLPIVVPQIKGVIQKPRGRAILDAGGDDVGATILGSLQDVLIRCPHDLLQVVNINRPFTEDAAGCLGITKEIETAARLKVTGIVGNSHLMDDTDPQTIIRGYELAKEVANSLDVPLNFITCELGLMQELDLSLIECPILPITRMLLPPWRRRRKVGSQNFLLS